MVAIARSPGLTYEDLEKMPDDGRRYELIAGEIYVAASPSRAHQEVILRLIDASRPFVRDRRLGEVIVAPFDVRLSEQDVVQPDILSVSNERLGILRENHTVGAPDLVVEVLSPSTSGRDEGAKLALYAAHGVREYWLADSYAARPTFRALALTPERVRMLPQDGDIVRSEVLPGLAIDVAALFRNLP